LFSSAIHLDNGVILVVLEKQSTDILSPGGGKYKFIKLLALL
jgi:hypothetical protein